VRRDFEESPLESVADFLRIVIGMVAFYAGLFVMPLLLLTPVVVMALFLAIFELLLGWTA
jgi:hypothetical protein